MDNRKIIMIIAAALAVILLVCIIFAIPMVKVPVNTVEKYQETGVKQVPYTVNETYVTTEVVDKVEVLYNGTPYSVPYGISVPFSITKPGTRLVGSFRLPAPGGFYLYGTSGKILYEKLAQHGDINLSLPNGEYEALVREGTAWGEQLSFNLKLQWSEPEEITRYKEITNTREEPYTVEKERTVTSYEKISVWKKIFSNK